MTKKIFFIIISIIALVLLIYSFYKANDMQVVFPIKKITIETKIINANKSKIFNLAKNYLLHKSFFNFKIDALKEQLEKIEWIKNVNVRRVYPDEIKIYVQEYIPKAIFNNNSYLNINGDKFFVDKIDKILPKLFAQDDRNYAIYRYYNLFNSNLLKNNIDSKVLVVSENDIRSLKIILSSGITIKLGSQNINERINMFFKIYDQLNSSDLDKIGYIDMRYSNGFSVGWK